MNKNNYFALRKIDWNTYDKYSLPAYLVNLSIDKNACILDFGCGFGQMVLALGRAGFLRVEGADINSEAISHLRSQQVTVYDLTTETSFYDAHEGRYDYVIMSHVLEHIPKDDIIKQLGLIRKLIKTGGALILMVPNAQSNTGCYWAYEDFTHHLLFTSGSLYYVLRGSGFSAVEFLDVDCIAGTTSALRRAARRFFLLLYQKKVSFWNRVTGSSFHEPSPKIFSYEIKCLARK
jgi:SAM-dependent methyltransferase